MAIKDLLSVQRKYILDSINATDYSEKTGEVDISNLLTTKGKLQFIASAFTSEAIYEYNLKKFHNNKTNILADHLQGLPSWLDIHFENYEIIKQGKEWGLDLSTEKKEDAFCENWWNLIANKVMQLMDKHDVAIKKYDILDLDFINDSMKKVEADFEAVKEVLKEFPKEDVVAVPHDNFILIYNNPEYKDKINNALEPLLSDKSLASLVKDFEQNPVSEFDGFNKKDLHFMGFKLEKSHKLADEYQVEYSKDIEEKMQKFGASKTWGHEGNSLSYAIFSVDNKEHPDYGKNFISIYENPNATPKLATMDNVLNELDEVEKTLDKSARKNR